MLLWRVLRWSMSMLAAIVLAALAAAQPGEASQRDCYHWFIWSCMLISNSSGDVGMALAAGRENGVLVDYSGCSGPARDFPELGIVHEKEIPQHLRRDLSAIEEQFDLPEFLVRYAKGVAHDDDPRFADHAERKQYITEHYGERKYAGFLRYWMRLSRWSAKNRAELCALSNCGQRHADCAIEHSEARPTQIFVDDGTPEKRYLVVARSTLMKSVSLSGSTERRSEDVQRVQEQGGQTVTKRTTSANKDERSVTTTSPRTDRSGQTTENEAASSATKREFGHNELSFAVGPRKPDIVMEGLAPVALRALQQCMAGKTDVRCEISQVLRNFGRPLQAPSSQSLLRAMVARGDVSSVSWLVKTYGAEPNTRNGRGQTSLLMAIEMRHAELVRVLIEAGADVNLADSDGRTALHRSVTLKKRGLLDQLLRAGADPNRQDSRGQTALHRAVDMQHGDLVRALIEGGADVDLADSHGTTALYRTAIGHDLALFEQLLRAGADPNRARSESGMPLLHMIAQLAALGDPPADMQMLSALLRWAEDEHNHLDFYARDRDGKLVHEVFWDSCPSGQEVRRRLSRHVPPPLDPSVYGGVEGGCETSS